MRRLLITLFVIMALGSLAQAQTTVNLTVSDTPDNQTWNNGTWSVQLIPGPGSLDQTRNFTLLVAGGSLASQSGSLSSTGTASFALPANVNIGPSGTKWQFTVCSQQGTACFPANITITTSSPQSVTISPPSIRVTANPNLPPVLVYTTTEISSASIGSQITVVGSTPSTPLLQTCTVVSGNTCTTWSSVGGAVAGSLGASPSSGYTITNTAVSQPWNGKLIVGAINTVSGSNSAFTAGTGFAIAATSGVPGATNVMPVEYLTGAAASSYSSAVTAPSSAVGAWAAGILALQTTGTPALVQATASTTSGATSLAFGSNNASGNCLVAAFRYGNAGYSPITSVTDTRSNTWIRAGVPSPSTGGNYLEVWYVQNAAAGANTVSVTYGGGASAGEIVIAEFSGVATSNAIMDYAISSGAPVASIPGATTDPQNTYSAVNNATGNVDFTGTDAAALINSAMGNLVNTGGQLYFKNGIYNLRTMTQDSIFSADFWAIGIPAPPISIVTGVQFLLIGESKTDWPGELAELGVAANNVVSNGVIFNVTAQSMGNVGTNTAAGIFQRPSTNASYRAVNDVFLQNLTIRFPTNQILNQIGSDLYFANNTSQTNIMADYNIPYGTIAVSTVSATGNIGITTALSSQGNIQHITDSYAVGSQYGFDIGEHTVGSGLTSIYCTNAGRATTNSHNITLNKVVDQENANGWVLATPSTNPVEINIFGYDIEIDSLSAPFARVKDLTETTPGTWRGLISYTKIRQQGGLAQNATPNIFGAANVNGGDGFVVIYNGGMRGTGYAQATAQTASIAATNLLPHPFVGTVYEIDFYLVTTTAGTGGTVSLTLTWNDGTAQTFTSSNLSLTAQGSLSGRVLAKIASGAVQYSTTVTGATGSPQYSVDVREIPRS